MAAFNPFQELGQAYEQAANSLVNNSISTLISQLTPVITTGLTLYILITGYMVVAGRIQDPISDILIKLTKWTIIAFIALNAGTITNYLMGGFNGLEKTILNAFGSDSFNIYESLDNSLERGLLAGANALDKNKELGITDLGKILFNYLVAVVMFFAVLMQTFIAGAIIMLAKASLLVVFALAPLLLAGLFFPQTAKFADAWFNQSLNYVLTVVIAAFFLQIANKLFDQQLSSIDANIQSDVISFIDLGKMTLLTIINFFVIKQSPSIASGLAGGVASGTASLIGAARAIASTGAGIGVAGGAARAIGSRSWSATKTSANVGIHAAAAARHPIQAARNAGRTIGTSFSNSRDRISNAWQRANNRVTGNGGNSVNKN